MDAVRESVEARKRSERRMPAPKKPSDTHLQIRLGVRRFIFLLRKPLIKLVEVTAVRTLSNLVGIRKACQISGFSETTMRRFADTGLIRSVRDPSGRRLLLKSDVEAVAQKQRGRQTEAIR